jgi:hypothetical protein
MLAAVGLLLIIAGRLRNIADKAERKHEQSREHLATLNQLLQISLGGKTLEAQLDEALDTVLAAPWLALEPRGGIFLAENDQLRLIAHRNLAEPLQSTCAKVPFGHCLCGRAAVEKTVVHAAQRVSREPIRGHAAKRPLCRPHRFRRRDARRPHLLCFPTGASATSRKSPICARLPMSSPA